MTRSVQDVEALLRAHYAAPDEGRCAETPALCRYAAGLLPAAERAAFEQHLGGCPDCRDDLDAFAATAWDEPPARSRWREVLRGVVSGRWRLGGSVALAAAAAGVLFLVLFPSGPQRSELPLRPKGSFALHVGVQRGGQTFRARPGVTLETNDRLGFFYSAPTAGQLMIVYAEEDGTVTPLYPARDGASAAAPAGAQVRVPDGAVVSPGRGCEWVVGLFAPGRFTRDAARGFVTRLLRERRGCRLDVPAGSGYTVEVLEVRR